VAEATVGSVKDPVIQLVRTLSTRAGRHREGRCVADGTRLVTQLLTSGCPVETVLVPAGGDPDPGLAAAADAAGVELLAARAGVLRHALGTAAVPDCVAVCAHPVEVAGGIPAGPLAVVCDRVLDAGNLGSIVRSALGLGPAAVVLTGDEDPGARRVIDASRGAVLRAALYRYPDPVGAVTALRAAGWWVVAADGGADRPLAPPGAAQARRALVVGNETDGIAPAVRRAADAVGAIPLAAGTESLNVAVAAGIGLWILDPAREAPGAGRG
jgi:TrmH family RNA methyltransferase